MRFTVKHIHMIGIGGTGMSGIAELLLSEGYSISGSDVFKSDVVKRLQSLGAEIRIGHTSEALLGADVVVVSSAISADNVEVKAARESQIPIISRAEMLAELMRFKHSIAVAGTHGKTTTTSMIAAILAQAEMDPTYVIGGRLNAISANAKLGSGEYLVAEADESDASFLHLLPVISVVTNIDEDHMGTYDNSIVALQNAFVEFLHNVPFWGVNVVSADDAGVSEIITRLSRKILRFGFDESAQYRAVHVRQERLQMLFDLRIGGIEYNNMVLSIPGEHNVSNALAAIAVADYLSIDMKYIREALSNFSGVGRRFDWREITWQERSFIWVDDYAHHPKEITATWRACHAAWESDRRRVVIVQPHRYSRVQHLFDDFIRVLAELKDSILIIMPVYSANEAHNPSADTASLMSALRLRGLENVLSVKDEEDLSEVIESILRQNDVLLSMGAGSISASLRKIFELEKND